MLKNRISQHISDIKHRHNKFIISNHFNTNHNLQEDFRIFIIKGNINWDDFTRQSNENKLISKHNTVYPTGLNEKIYPVFNNYISVPYCRVIPNTLSSLLINSKMTFSYNKPLVRFFHKQKF